MLPAPCSTLPAPSSPLPALRRRVFRCLLWFSALCFLLSALCYVFRSPLLTGAARLWMINESPAPADAIVVLGGGAQFRPFEAARLYHAGLAPVVLVMNSELRATDIAGLTIPEAELNRRVLLSNAVPPEIIQLIGTNLTSTHEEALTLRQWSKDAHAQSFLIPTGPFQSRRTKWVFRKAFRDHAARLTVTSIQPEACLDWWRDEKTLLDFQNEVVKDLYYHLKY